MTSFDIHAHVATPVADALISGEPGFSARLGDDAVAAGAASSAANRELVGRLIPRLTDRAQRLREMDAARVDVQLVSPMPVSNHWLDEDLARRYGAAVNDEVAEFCDAAPARLLPVATAILHHPALAVAELRRAYADHEVAGVQISTTAGPLGELDRPEVDEFWATVVELDLPVLIHPWGCSLGARLDVGYMFNHVGNPTETSVALNRLIFGGVLDRFPALKIWGAHGGGWFPSYSSRADHAWEQREDARTCAHKPSDYLKRMWFDALVYTPEAVRHLVAQVGVDRVTVGSDYPFDMGVEDAIDRIEVAVPEHAATITHDNAIALIGRAHPRLERILAGGGL